MNIVIQLVLDETSGFKDYEKALRRRSYFKKINAASILPPDTTIVFTTEKGQDMSFSVTNDRPLYYNKSDTLILFVILDNTDIFEISDFVNEMEKWDEKEPES